MKVREVSLLTVKQLVKLNPKPCDLTMDKLRGVESQGLYSCMLHNTGMICGWG